MYSVKIKYLYVMEMYHSLPCVSVFLYVFVTEVKDCLKCVCLIALGSTYLLELLKTLIKLFDHCWLLSAPVFWVYVRSMV